MLAQLAVGQWLAASYRRPRRPDPAPAGQRRRTCPHPAGWARRFPRGSRSWGKHPSPAKYGSWGRPSTTALAYSAMRSVQHLVGSWGLQSRSHRSCRHPTQRPQPTQCSCVDVHLAGLRVEYQTVVGALLHDSGGSPGRCSCCTWGLPLLCCSFLPGPGAAAHADDSSALRRSRSSRGP